MIFFIFLLMIAGQAYGQVVKQDTIFLSWDANIEQDLSHYKAYIGESQGDYTFSQDSITELFTKFWIPTSNDKTYYLAVTAFDSSGNESEFSEEVSISNRDIIPPAAPSNPNARLILLVVLGSVGIGGIVLIVWIIAKRMAGRKLN